MKRLKSQPLPSMTRPDNTRELIANVLPLLVANMAERGPIIRTELKTSVGGELKPGHVVDALMTAAANMEMAIRDPQPEAFIEHASIVLLLARDLAYLLDKIKPQPEAAPS